MRVLAYGFGESPLVFASALRTLEAASDVELVGWVGRARAGARQRFLATVEYFPEPLPDGWKPQLGHDALLGADEALEDENLRYLLDRERHFRDQYEVTQLRSAIVCYAQEIIERSRPDAVVFSDVPHTALSYAIYLDAQRKGIATRHFRFGPAPHLFTFTDRIGPPLVDFVGPTLTAGEPLPESREFLARLRGEYRGAAPAFIHKERTGEGTLARGLRTIRERPGMLVDPDLLAKARTHVRRHRVREAYERRAVDADEVRRDCVVMYLHVQPERSTTPEGGFYAQQWIVAYLLSTYLPDGWELAIREHPLTFLTGPRLVRTAEFYDSLLAIPRVKLISTRSDPFALIDRARAVATVTGTAGLEAVVRGTPAIIFGDASYRSCPGTFHVEEPDDVGAVMAEIEAGPTWTEEDLLQFLATFEASPRVVVDSSHGNDFDAAVAGGEVHARVLALMLDDLREHR